MHNYYKPVTDLNDHNEATTKVNNDTPAYVKLNPNVNVLFKPQLLLLISSLLLV